MIKRSSLQLSEIISVHRFATIAVVGVLCAYASVIQPAMALTNTWTFNGNGNWDDGPKWSLGIPANGSSTIAVIDDGDTAVTVTLDSSHTIGELSLGTNDTLLIQANSNSATLTSANSFTNNGTIRLTGIGIGGASRVTVQSGTLTNSATGLIDFQAGPEGRSMDGDLINNGTVTMNHDVTLDKFQGSHTNNGSWSVASATTLTLASQGTLNQNGGTFTLNGTLQSGTFTQNGGTFSFGSGALVQNLAYNYLGGSISGTPTLHNTVLTLGPGTSPASFFMDASNTLASDVRAGQTITLQANTNSVTLTSVNGYTNNGTIRLTGIGAGGASRVTVQSGTLTNSATGLIDFQAGPEGRSMDGDLINNGTVTMNHDVTLDKFQGSHTNNGSWSVASATTLTLASQGTLNQNGGTFTLNGTLQSGTFTQNGGTFSFGSGALVQNLAYNYLGGSISGTPTLHNTVLTLGPGTSPASFFMDASNTLASDVRAGQTITLQANTNSVTLTSVNGYTNNGTIRLTGIGAGGGSRLTVSSGTLTNSATGLIDFQAGPEGRSMDGDLINNGTVTMNHDVTLDKFQGSHTNNGSWSVASATTLTLASQGTLNQNGGTFTLNGTLQSGTFTQNGGTFSFGSGALVQNLAYNYLGGSISGTPTLHNTVLTLGPGTSPASFFMDASNTLASDVRAGQTITLQANSNSVTLLNNNGGFTNNGTIRLTGIGAGGGSRLTVSSGTLTNSATGLIDFQAGPEGRSMDGDLINNGTVTMNHDVTLDKFQGSHTNNGSWSVASATTLTLASQGTLNQNGGTFTLNGTLQSGTFTQNGGTFSFGSGALVQNLAYNYLGGSISGTPTLHNTVLTLGPGTSPASFFMDASNTLASDVRAGQTITLQANSNSVTLLNNNGGFTNNGTIRLTGIGAGGGSRLTVSSGTLTNSATGLIDFQAGPEGRSMDADLVNNGTVTVNHDTTFDKFQGALTNNGSLVIATGTTLTLASQGTLTNNSGTTLTGGTYDLAGTLQYGGASIVTNQAEIILRPNGQILDSSSANALVNLATNGSSGTFRLRDGRSFAATVATFTNNGVMDIGSGSTFSGTNLSNSATGVLRGTGSINANVTNAGTVAPGASPGTLTIGNNYTQTSTGTLAIELASSSSFDVLRDTNTATLGGTLSLALLNGFIPSFSSTFTVFDGNALIGTFANAANGQRLSTVGGEGSFVVSYPAGTGDVVLSNFAVAGDYNGNGVVDAGDYVLWRKTPANYGGAGGYNVWRSNFGRTNLPGAGSGSSSVSSQTAVPEPGTIALMLFGLLGFTVGSRRNAAIR